MKEAAGRADLKAERGGFSTLSGLLRSPSRQRERAGCRLKNSGAVVLAGGPETVNTRDNSDGR